MRATTEFFKDREKVVPPGEGVMGVTLRKSYKREIRELREALAQAEKERDEAQIAGLDLAVQARRLRKRLEKALKERDEAIEAHEEMAQARDDVRDEKWDEYLNAKCAELVKERDEWRELAMEGRRLAKEGLDFVDKAQRILESTKKEDM